MIIPSVATVLSIFSTTHLVLIILVVIWFISAILYASSNKLQVTTRRILVVAFFLAVVVLIAAVVTGRQPHFDENLSQKQNATFSKSPTIDYTSENMDTQDYPRNEVWVVKEGVENPPEWIAEWVVLSRGVKFDCKQKNIHSGEIITGECIVIQSWRQSESGAYVAIKRFNKQDGNDCIYFGMRTSNSVEGKYYCKDTQGEFDWSATISPSN